MSITGRNLSAGFYWIGVGTTLGCLALVLAGNTDLVYRFEHVNFPLSWALAAVAVLAFLAAEFCPLSDTPANEVAVESPQSAPEWETAEV
jgi:hypothetical protein